MDEKQRLIESLEVIKEGDKDGYLLIEIINEAIDIIKGVKWDEKLSPDNESKEDAVFWFIDQDNKEGQKYKVWFDESGSTYVQNKNKVWSVLKEKDSETLSSIFKLDAQS